MDDAVQAYGLHTFDFMVSMTQFGKSVEVFIRGYRLEHFVLSLQVMVTLLVSLIPVMVNEAYNALHHASAFWIPVGAIIVFEPCTGNALRKYFLRVLALLVALAMGVCVLLVAFSASSTHTDTRPVHYTVYVHVMCIGIILCAGLIMLHRLRWAQDLEYAFFLCQLALMMITVPSARDTRHKSVTQACWTAVDLGIGVTISAVITATVFPIKARDMLQRETAVVLLHVGDLAAWVMSEVADSRPDVGSDVGPGAQFAAPHSLPGASGTDHEMRFLDDGLVKRLAPLYDQCQKLAVHMARLDDLLRSARAEFNIFSRPHWFPAKTYGALLLGLHTSVSLLQTQLHIMANGAFSTACTCRVAPDIREAGMELSAAFTLLSRMSYEPKPLRKRFRSALRRWRVWLVDVKKSLGRGLASARNAAARKRGKDREGGLAGNGVAPPPSHAAAVPGDIRGLGWVDREALVEVFRGSSRLSVVPSTSTIAPGTGGGATPLARTREEGEGSPPPVSRPSGASSGEPARPADGELLDDPFAAMAEEPSAAGPGSPEPAIQLSGSELERLEQAMRAVSRKMPDLEGGAAADDPGGSMDGDSPEKASSPGESLPKPVLKLVKLDATCKRIMLAGQGVVGHGAWGGASLVQTAACLTGLLHQAGCVLGSLDPVMAAQLHRRIFDCGQ